MISLNSRIHKSTPKAEQVNIMSVETTPHISLRMDVTANDEALSSSEYWSIATLNAKGIIRSNDREYIELNIPTSAALAMAADRSTNYLHAAILCYALRKRARVEGVSEPERAAIKEIQDYLLERMRKMKLVLPYVLFLANLEDLLEKTQGQAENMIRVN